MPNVFSVELFYGNVGFTADYSNVLQFNNEQARDKYFDRITEKVLIENTSLNNININGNKVKIAFVDKTDIDKLENYNYIRIKSVLYGNEASQKVEYGFIVDFNIVTSYEDVTVVEFTYLIDIWQNYQFSFTLKECNVARCHMDRWDSNGHIKYTKPSLDNIPSYMNIKRTERCIDETEFVCLEFSRHDSTLGNLYKVVKKNKKYALCIVTYTESQNTSSDSPIQLRMLYFPILLDGSQVIRSTTLPYNQELGFLALASVNSEVYPSLNDVLGGNIADVLDIVPSSVYNVQIVFDTGLVFVTRENNDEKGTYIQGETGQYREYTKEYQIITPTQIITFRLLYKANEFGLKDSVFNINHPIWDTEKIWNITQSVPICPVNNSDYSESHEPMLYKSPVMKRYISKGNASEITEIPDIKFPFDKLYINNIISPGNSYNIITTESIENTNIASENAIASLVSFVNNKGDIISDVWKEYCMTQRDSDRKMMWANILTGGVAESGSTAVSAGIGYRSNQERSDMYDIMSNYHIANQEYDKARQDIKLRNMYGKYGKQAMAFSGVGGITAFTANAVGNAIGQSAKEQAIKNTPGAIGTSDSWYGELTNDLCYNTYVELRCDDESYNEYANIYKKFGYAINSVITPDIKSRKYFNYIKTNGAILTGNANQSILTALSSIFDNGVTIWHMDYTTKATLYDYTKENIERSLM